MKVSDILRVKGGTLFTTQPDKTLSEAASLMAELDVGSLVVLDAGALSGMLTFREVIAATVRNGGSLSGLSVREVMEAAPMSCGPDTDLDEVRRMMLQRHARYMPVLDASALVGVVSFYDVAKAVVESQDFENRMLKAYIRDWPSEEAGPARAS
jgi:CBS domain-containing protein